jgi:hypothetical protein
VNPSPSEKESPSQPVDDKKFVQEYRRTCQDCGKVWHSLEGREKQIQRESTCCYCSMCYPRVSKDWDVSQDSRTRDERENELVRLRTCPSCNSTNYQEEILTYERK